MPAPAPASARLILPSAALADCVRACLVRDTTRGRHWRPRSG
jgi:hypothetical protein